jgi:hypothetical protein
VTRITGGEQRPSNDRLYDSVGVPLLRTRRKNAFARFVLDMLARGRKRRHDPGQSQEPGNG